MIGVGQVDADYWNSLLIVLLLLNTSFVKGCIKNQSSW